jgi:hypothetical protein
VPRRTNGIAMTPETAAILWTALALLWMRSGVLGGIIVAMVCFEVFYLLSSLPIQFFERWPLLRPSSVPMSALAAILLLLAGCRRIYALSRKRDAGPDIPVDFSRQ